MLVLVAGLLLAADNTQQTSDDTICLTTDERERVRNLMLESVDDGLKEYTINQFGVMIKDPTDQPNRAIKGMRPAIVAYVTGRAAIMTWSPPICERKVAPP